MASGYVSGTFSEAEREDYTKVDVDPPSGTEKEMGFQDMKIQESEAILPLTTSRGGVKEARRSA